MTCCGAFFWYFCATTSRKVSKHSLLSISAAGICFLFLAAHLRAQVPILEKLGATEGLSQGMVYDMLQDRQGFLWFATKDGLNRYDGYSFKVFQNDPFNPFSITDNEIICLLEDHAGRIWAGTLNNGLSVFDPQRGQFYSFNRLSSQSVNCLAETPDGTVWAGTNHGINRLHLPESLPMGSPRLESVIQADTFLLETPLASLNVPPNRIVDIIAAKDGKLWISSFLQIGYFDPQTGRYQLVFNNPLPGNGEFVSPRFLEGPDGAIWVGLPEQLLRFRGGQLDVFQLPERSPYPLTTMAFDEAGHLFVATRKKIFKLNGASAANPATARFELFYSFPLIGIMGSTQLLMDRGGLLWIGTNGYGIRKYNPGNRHFHHYLPGKSPRRIVTDRLGRTWVWVAGGLFLQLVESENRLGRPLFTNPGFLHHDCVQTKDGAIWVVCESKHNQRGVGYLVRLNGETLREEFETLLPVSIGVYSRIYEDGAGNLWVTSNQSALLRFDPLRSKATSYDYSAATGFREAAISIHQGQRGHFWIGTPHGLVQGIPEGDSLKFVLHKNNPSDPQSIHCNSVLTSLDDPLDPGRYCWLGTKGGGLERLDKHNGTFKHYSNVEGLPNNVVYAILPDSKGNLWLSTNCGLSKFDPKQGVFQNFFSVDGLQDNEFNTLSYNRAPDGRMYFGGVNGITAFYPEDISASTKSPPVLITSLKVNNQSFPFGQRIVLDYQQNQLTFEFAAMDFASPRMNQYRYRLLDADQNWVESTTANAATYAHLPPGKYIFEVLTGGSRGIWTGTPARLEIHILPPWWRSNWAYLLYVVAVISGGWLFYRFQVNKIRLENKLRFEHQEAVRLSDLDRLKTNFFSSVTHEFRTPLTLLLEPVRQLLAEAKDTSQRYRLELIENNARKLLQFVNQLLDLSKLEAGQMPLDLRAGNPVKTILAVAEQFQSLALQRSITLELDLPELSLPVLYDEIKWEQVVTNLLSNALKFTNKGGAVTLKLEKTRTPDNKKKLFRLVVADTGIGIPPESLPHVFDRFYQADASSRGGTGIGLSLTKELIEHMGGKISVESSPGVGTSFTVQLPCDVAPMEALGEHPHPPSKFSSVREHPALELIPPVEARSDTPMLLIVEDDPELRQFLRTSLPADYRITEASDGAEGIQMAFELVPDLVISDLVMPHKDGFELAETLKNAPTTSHIPIILLTAKSAVESKIQGLKRGADLYLTKPFRADELVAHIESLLTIRKQLHEQFSRAAQHNATATLVEAALPVQEHEFLQRLIQVVEANLDNEAMDAEAFARAVFISRSQLHRKINALTGMSLSEFVRNHRLDRAKEMLSKREGSISEIAWRTGFPNSKYFSTCFKERFGVTPSGFVAGE